MERLKTRMQQRKKKGIFSEETRGEGTRKSERKGRHQKQIETHRSTARYTLYHSCALSCMGK